jgi:inhibitor of cysteine peptidase
MIELSDTDPRSSVQLALGEELVIRLPENPTTGYRWQFAQSGTGALKEVEDRFVAGAEHRGGPVPGAGGHRVAKFVAEKNGSVQLEAVERREWEPLTKSLQRRIYAIVVR